MRVGFLGAFAQLKALEHDRWLRARPASVQMGVENRIGVKPRGTGEPSGKQALASLGRSVRGKGTGVRSAAYLGAHAQSRQKRYPGRCALVSASLGGKRGGRMHTTSSSHAPCSYRRVAAPAITMSAVFLAAAATAASSSLSIRPLFADASGGATVTLTRETPFDSHVHAEVKCVFGTKQVCVRQISQEYSSAQRRSAFEPIATFSHALFVCARVALVNRTQAGCRRHDARRQDCELHHAPV